MLLRTHLSSVATLAFVLLGMAGLAHAGPQPAMVKSWSGASSTQAPIVLAQASDPRVTGLEEEVRRLNGKVEELNFLILQMEDQLRKMQEDNEFRFQELEGGGNAGGSGQKRSEAPVTAPPGSSDVAGVTPQQQPLQGTGEPPRTLGNIVFDQNGNVLGAQQGEVQSQPTDNPAVAALPASDDPQETYRNAYEFLMAGDYKTAETGFRNYLVSFPEGEQAPDASFWLGDSVLQQGRHQEAAEIFLKANKDYPNSPKAPEMLLKLGVTLAAMKQKDIACATFEEVGARYPELSNVLKERVKREQASVGC